MTAILLAPTRAGAADRLARPGAIRRFLAGLAAGYLLAVSLGLPVAQTRDVLESGLLSAPASAAGFERTLRALPRNNPDDDLSDAIPVAGLVVFPSPVTRLDVPREAPEGPAGEPGLPRAKVVSTRADFERGPPPLA